MPRPVWFEIPADDPARAIKFYEEVFGWKITRFDGPLDYWVAETGTSDEPGTDGAIMPRSMGRSVRSTINVPSIDDYMARVQAAGGKLLMPKVEISGGMWAMCADTEGNEVCLMQPDPVETVP